MRKTATTLAAVAAFGLTGETIASAQVAKPSSVKGLARLVLSQDAMPVPQSPFAPHDNLQGQTVSESVTFLNGNPSKATSVRMTFKRDEHGHKHHFNPDVFRGSFQEVHGVWTGDTETSVITHNGVIVTKLQTTGSTVTSSGAVYEKDGQVIPGSEVHDVRHGRQLAHAALQQQVHEAVEAENKIIAGQPYHPSVDGS